MTSRWHYEVRAHSTAPPATVWSLVGEAARWKDWSFLTRAFLLQPGQLNPDGVGALRRFAVGPFGTCEEVVQWEPPAHLGYVARKGLPVRNYRADIVPGTGPMILAFTRGFARLFARQLVRAADRQAGKEHSQ